MVKSFNFTKRTPITPKILTFFMNFILTRTYSNISYLYGAQFHLGGTFDYVPFIYLSSQYTGRKANSGHLRHTHARTNTHTQDISKSRSH